MATYVIGDLQGCLEPLERLLEKIEFQPARDRLWFTGDLVNRGPDSLGVLRRVFGLGERAVCVLGNHDLHLLAIHHVEGTRTRKGDTLDPILAAPDRDILLGWLRAQPLLHIDPDFNCALVHAGIPPDWDLAQAVLHAEEVEAALRGPRCSDFLATMYGNEPDRWSPRLDAAARLRFTTNCLTRMRYLTEDGRLDLRAKGGLEASRPGLVPWFMAPGRRVAGTRILFGHWSTLHLSPEQEVRYGVHALDTGAVWGGRLSALRLEDRVRFEVPGLASGPPIPGLD